MCVHLPSTFQAVFCSFASAFSTPSYANFVTLTTGWMLCQGRHTISRVIQTLGSRRRGKHHSAFYRFFSRAVWEPDAVGRILFDLMLPLIPGAQLILIIDDTLCRRSGPHFWGAGMHHDPLVSTYGRGAARWIAWAFGHNWVTLSVWVPYPWNRERGLAIPILWRLYQSKKRCPSVEYRKRTELARELVQIVAEWLPVDRKPLLAADAEYACKTVVRGLPAGWDFVGPMSMKAALFDLPVSQPLRGRHRYKGVRLPTPESVAKDPAIQWRKVPIRLYGHQIKLKMKAFDALWPTVSGRRPVQVVITRDPRGRLSDRVYFSTATDFTPFEVLQAFSRRWSLEVTFYNAKQFMGLEDPQNGWGRRPAGSRRGRKRAGPQPRGRKGERAIRRTVPLIFCSYGLVVVWYFLHGKPQEDVSLARRLCPWYRHKVEPSFADMLAAARRVLWSDQLLAHPALRRVGPNIRQLIPEWLLAG